MAAAEQDLLFESFLKKRKDTMIFRWSNYWFRLRNTTLSFYTSSEANETCLRGKYYIYLVQSVREVKTLGASHTFEIVMKNGKRKLLSADSADLCKIWIQFLWKSMQLPAPGRKTSSCTWHDIPALEEKANAAVQIRPESRNNPLDSQSEPVTDSPADAFHSENGSYSEDDDSPLPSVSDCTSPGIAAGKEMKGVDENQFFAIYDFPNSKSISNKPAGVSTAHAEQGAAGCGVAYQDEHSGRSASV